MRHAQFYNFLLFMLLSLFLVSPNIIKAQVSVPVFDIENAHYLSSFPNSRYHAQISQDGRYIVAVNSIFREPNAEYPVLYKATYLELWEMRSVQQVNIQIQPQATYSHVIAPSRILLLDQSSDGTLTRIPTSQLKISPDSKRVAVTVGDIWQIYRLPDLTLESEISALEIEWSMDGQRLIVQQDDVLGVWSVEEAYFIKKYSLNEYSDFYMFNAVPVEDGWVIEDYSDNLTLVCLLRNEQCDEFRLSAGIPPYFPDVLVVTTENQVLSYDIQSLELSDLEQFRIIDSPCHSPDFQYICLRGGYIWDLKDRTFVNELPNYPLAWSSSSNLFYVFQPEQTLQVYAVGEQTPLTEISMMSISENDWDLLRERNSATTQFEIYEITSHDHFVLVNLGFTLVYLPITMA